MGWREGSKATLRSRFAVLRVRPAYGDDRQGGLLPEQWLLMEWPTAAVVPSGYWLANLPAKTSLRRLVGISKHRWVSCLRENFTSSSYGEGLETGEETQHRASPLPDSATMKNSNRNSVWVIMKAATGGDFTTTQHSALRRTAS